MITTYAENRAQAVQTSHIEEANGVAEMLLSNYGSDQQREFIYHVKNTIDKHYQRRTEELEKDLCSLKEAHRMFVGLPTPH